MQFDPLRLDQELRSAVRDRRRFRRALLTSPHTAKPFELSPRLGDPEVREALRSNEDPLSPALLSWIERLREEAAVARFMVSEAKSYRREPLDLDLPTAGRYTRRELLGHALAKGEARSAWLAAYLESGSELRRRTREIWDRRAEFRETEHIEYVNPAYDNAGAWLELSADMYAEFRSRDLPELIHRALGSELSEGWPSRISARSLADLLREARWFDGLSLDPEPLPQTLAASSFLRALAVVGRAWHEAAVGNGGLFATSRDPGAQPESINAALFGSLPLSAAFSRRRLGLGPTRIREHLRGIARVVLIETRARALRVLIEGPALRGRQAFEEAFLEHSARAFGFELPREAAGLLWRLASEGQGFAASLLAAEQSERLVNEHDEDWFRNPRAVEELRAQARMPIAEPSPERITSGQAALLRTLAAALA